MSLLIIGNFHHKNMAGIAMLSKELKLKYKFGTINDINNFDIIYLPMHAINTSLYPTKKFIFGPHFSIYPDNRLYQIHNVHKNILRISHPNMVYWCMVYWENFHLLLETYI